MKLVGALSLFAFPLAGVALSLHLLSPLAFVAVSLLTLALFGAATMRLHRA